VGDVAAYRLGSLARGFFSAGHRAATTFGRNVSEYLQEESRDVPPRFELDEFAQGVDRLRDDVERAAARLALIERRRT
jgi:ubiquinone biosynthesis protein UbiJ